MQHIMRRTFAQRDADTAMDLSELAQQRMKKTTGQRRDYTNAQFAAVAPVNFRRQPSGAIKLPGTYDRILQEFGARHRQSRASPITNKKW
jgi:hypothetical protein